MSLIKTNKIFDSEDLLFFGEKVLAWKNSKKHSLEDLVNNYVDPNNYPLKGQKQYQKKLNIEFENFINKVD